MLSDISLGIFFTLSLSESGGVSSEVGLPSAVAVLFDGSSDNSSSFSVGPSLSLFHEILLSSSQSVSSELFGTVFEGLLGTVGDKLLGSPNNEFLDGELGEESKADTE